MKLSFLITTGFLLIILSGCGAQQVPDENFNPEFQPRHTKGTGPVVVIDEAHHNFHTAEGRYAPFAKVLTLDGYRIRRGTVEFTDESLKGADVLVIANAVNEVNVSSWQLPTPSAFNDDEIKAVNAWVKEGGSLFLIADHMPFPGNAHALAASFGFTFYNGFARDTTAKGPDLFTFSAGTVKENDITAPEGEKIDSIYSFTGQGFDIPAEAEPILSLHPGFQILMPEVAWQFDDKTEIISGAGKYQAACLKFGKGRVVVFGEAAMFSAQIAGGKKVGMNAEYAKNNIRLLRSVMRWLTDTE